MTCDGSTDDIADDCVGFKRFDGVVWLCWEVLDHY